MAEPKIAYYYNAEANPRRERIAGVPWKDLTEEQVAGYPMHIQKQLEASKYYRKTPKPKPKVKEPPKEEEKKEVPVEPAKVEKVESVVVTKAINLPSPIADEGPGKEK